MKHIVLFICAILLVSCQTSKNALTEKSNKELQVMLGIQNDKEFDIKLEEIAKRKTKQSVLLILNLMIELPWEKELKPQHRLDRRMKKI